MRTRIAVDTGGTFTDFVCVDGEGIRVHKVRSTPDDPARAILTGIRELLGTRPPEEIIHGSTVATNALLERKGARVAFVTTAGFEDLLAIGRQTRSDLYRLTGAERRPLIPEGLTFGIEERIGAGGVLVHPLTDTGLDALCKQLRKARPESVAVCLLHSYANPEHEQRIAHRLQEEGIAVSASHLILREHREFERGSTTAVNAYVGPVMSRYLKSLAAGLSGASLRVFQSAGGFISADDAAEHAVQTVLSGPAGGAVGALTIAKASGVDKVIAFDMGGTSTDVSLLDGYLPTNTESVIGDFPIRLPMLDIHTAGAGGGSIAFLDATGALRVGPRSAGASPGPACYGSGDELTVTDANLLLGRLPADLFLGGRMTLYPERAAALAETMAASLNLSVTQLAEGIIRVANSNMERALRVVSVQRGHDPREFALLAFGGAGPMHACELAQALDMRTVLVPRHAGALSALGMLLSDYTTGYSRSVLQTTDSMTEAQLAKKFEPLEQSLSTHLGAEGFGSESIKVERLLDLRYLGQSYEITVPYGAGYRSRFDQMHQAAYGYRNEQRTVEVVNVRVKGTAPTAKPILPRRECLKQRLPEGSQSDVVFGGLPHRTTSYEQGTLEPGMSGTGPAIIAGGQSTTVVPPGWIFSVDAIDTLVLTFPSAAEQTEAA